MRLIYSYEKSSCKTGLGHSSSLETLLNTCYFELADKCSERYSQCLRHQAVLRYGLLSLPYSSKVQCLKLVIFKLSIAYHLVNLLKYFHLHGTMLYILFSICSSYITKEKAGTKF